MGFLPRKFSAFAIDSVSDLEYALIVKPLFYLTRVSTLEKVQNMFLRSCLVKVNVGIENYYYNVISNMTDHKSLKDITCRK